LAHDREVAEALPVAANIVRAPLFLPPPRRNSLAKSIGPIVKNNEFARAAKFCVSAQRHATPLAANSNEDQCENNGRDCRPWGRPWWSPGASPQAGARKGRPYATDAQFESRRASIKSPARFPARAIDAIREFQFPEYTDFDG
jgi:hypothetical protein